MMLRKTLRIFALCTVSAVALASQSADAQTRAPRPGTTAPQADYNTPQYGAPQSNPTPAPAANPYAGYEDQYGAIDDGRAQAAREQAQGNYPEMERMSQGIPLGSIQDAWSRPTENMADGQVAPGVVQYLWRPEMVMPMRIRENMVTKIILPDWEEAVEVIAGDDYYMQSIKMHANIVGIRSSASGIDTTVDVVGSSGNVYSFYVRAESFNTKKLTDISVFVKAPPSASRAMTGRNGITPTYSAWGSERPWNSGSHQRQAMTHGDFGAAPVNYAPQARDVYSVHKPIPEMMRFDMRMFEVNPGDREIAPDMVYTDAGAGGIGWTYFDFGERAQWMERPAIFKVVDGVETRVNTRTVGKRGEVIVAETTGDFILRLGQHSVCVKRVPVAN